jgi:hypothetical protein
MSEPYYFWLGASAEAETGSREPDQQAVPALTGFDPARMGECVPYEPPSLADDC